MKEIKNDKIFDLLAEKSYQELNNDERELVDKELSSSDYESFRNIISDFKDVDESIELTNSKTKFKEVVVKKMWWNYRIPTYQVAAVLVIAILSTFMFTKNSMQQSVNVALINNKPLDTLTNFKKSINMEQEKYPTAFVINW